eukprot:scaffold26383_cov99-Isochrysis_galbana.AAC.3
MAECDEARAHACSETAPVTRERTSHSFQRQPSKPVVLAVYFRRVGRSVTHLAEFRQLLRPIFGLVGRQDPGPDAGSEAIVVAGGAQSVHIVTHSQRALAWLLWDWLDSTLPVTSAELKHVHGWACKRR